MIYFITLLIDFESEFIFTFSISALFYICSTSAMFGYRSMLQRYVVIVVVGLLILKVPMIFLNGLLEDSALAGIMRHEIEVKTSHSSTTIYNTEATYCNYNFSHNVR